MNAPKLIESIPSVTAPVQMPEAEAETPSSRARFLAGVISGGVTGAIAIGLLIVALVKL